MANETILVVDDEAPICLLLEECLKLNDYRVVSANRSEEALLLARSEHPDLIILDVMLPGLDGFEVCQALRKFTLAPIMFLSGRNADVDKIAGLTLGGDDYITKPFNPDELLARVKAQLRRSQMLSEYAPSEFVLQFPGLVIDPLHYRVEFNDRIIDLSMKEFQLLYLMAREPERIFSLEELFKMVWGAESHGDTRTVMVHISNLRKKIENATASLEYIHTIRGRGYQFFVG